MGFIKEWFKSSSPEKPLTEEEKTSLKDKVNDTLAVQEISGSVPTNPVENAKEYVPEALKKSIGDFPEVNTREILHDQLKNSPKLRPFAKEELHTMETGMKMVESEPDGIYKTIHEDYLADKEEEMRKKN